MTDISTLMERLRIQSIIQRLKRSIGEQAALDVVLSATELEFRDTINKTNEQTQRTRITNASRRLPKT